MAQATKRDLKFFMRETKEEIVTAPGPDSFRDDDGNPIELEIRVLSNTEIQKINDSYKKRGIATDKKGNPYIANGEVVFRTDRDSSRASRHILVEALVHPNLKDKELMAFYQCNDVTEMPLHVFSRADEFAHVNRMVMGALGLGGAPAVDDEALRDEAKN